MQDLQSVRPLCYEFCMNRLKTMRAWSLGRSWAKNVRKNFTARVKVVLFLALSISLIVLIWSLSFYLVRHSDASGIKTLSDLATLLFGTTSVALFIFSIVIAVLALIGWQSIISAVRETARETALQASKPWENEFKGRVYSAMGYMIGEMSIKEGALEAKDLDRMQDAVSLCQKGYEFMKDAGEPAKFMGLNNLVFYLCLAEDVSRREFLLKSAHELMEAGQEHNAINLQLTAYRVMLQFGDDRERTWARSRLIEITTSRNVSEKERKEAKLHLASSPQSKNPPSAF